MHNSSDNSPNSLLDKLDHLVRQSVKLGAHHAEAAALSSRSISAAVRLGQTETLESSHTLHIALRVFIQQTDNSQLTFKTAGVSCDAHNPNSLKTLPQHAVDRARASSHDPFASFPDKSLVASQERVVNASASLNLLHPLPSLPTLLNDALDAENAALEHPLVSNSQGAQSIASQNSLARVASNGLSCVIQSSRAHRSIAVLASKNGKPNDESQRDYSFSNARSLQLLPNPQNDGRDAAQRAASRLQSVKPQSIQNCPVIFEPRVASSFLNHIAEALAGPALLQNSSFLKDRINSPFFPKDVNISDDPDVPKGLRSTPIDAEGLPTHPSHIVLNGVINNVFTNLSSAQRLQKTPSAHAARSLVDDPSVHPHNLYLHNGDQSHDNLISHVKNGALVTELLGFGFNPVTGDYSRGAAGFLIKNGRLSQPFHEAVVAANLLRSLPTLRCADNLQHLTGIDSPSIMLERFTIAGQ